MSFTHASEHSQAAGTAQLTTSEHGRCCIAAPEPPAGTATAAPWCARQLVRAAILRGLLLDDPWRHAFLRNRWIGR